MNSARKLAADPPKDASGRDVPAADVSASASSTETPVRPAAVASWYAQGLSDGLGDRLLMFDNTAAASLELLRFRPELAAAPGFERALRESVERLAFFKHASFAHARAVEYLDGDEGLALVSTHTPGKRLSEMFQARQPRAGMHPAFVAWLIRQLAPAVADFHAHGRGIAHGALTPERIVLTGDGRVVVVEHVLGAALDQLRLSPKQLWRELGVVAVAGFDGTPRLNGNADVVQLGLMALAVLLGRRVTPEDYANHLPELLDEFAQNAGKRAPNLVSPLRDWLERALQLSGTGYESAIEAAQGLGALPAAGQQAFEHVQAKPAGVSPSRETSMNDSRDRSPDRAGSRDDSRMDAIEIPATIEPVAASAETQKAAAPAAEIALGTGPTFGSSIVDAEVDPAPAGFGRFLTARNVAAACAVLALVEAAVIGRMMSGTSNAPGTSASTPAEGTIPVTIDSPVPGDVVMVDGRQVGVTPFKLDVASSMRSIRVHSLERLQAPTSPAPARAQTPPPAPPPAVESADARNSAAIAAAAVRQRSGGLRLTSPIDLQVLEGEKVLGSSADGPIVATAGTHQLDFINSALGFRVRQSVEIRAGQIVALTIKPPDGRLSINAQPWAQVWIDGKAVGETPLANLTVPVGEHEILFRHPQLGERKETAIVRAGGTSRISANLAR